MRTYTTLFSSHTQRASGMKLLAASLAALAGSANATRQSTPGHRTLFPAHPPGHDANDLAHLVPVLQQTLHY